MSVVGERDFVVRSRLADDSKEAQLFQYLTRVGVVAGVEEVHVVSEGRRRAYEPCSRK